MQKPSKQMKNETVAFNLANQDEKDMRDFAKKRNFSNYVKRLIWADMVRRSIIENGGEDEGKDTRLEEITIDFSPTDFI